ATMCSPPGPRLARPRLPLYKSATPCVSLFSRAVLMGPLEPWLTPWTGVACRRLPHARDELVRLCGPASAQVLPERVEILFDESFSQGDIVAFIESVAAQLARETAIWRQRLDLLTDGGLIDKHVLGEACRGLRSAQTWYISASQAGGLTAG